MRTTIELNDELEARLTRLAARRGLADYESLIKEALNAGLREMEGKFQSEGEYEEAKRRALEAIGSFSEEEAEALRERVHEARKHWR